MRDTCIYAYPHPCGHVRTLKVGEQRKLVFGFAAFHQ